MLCLSLRNMIDKTMCEVLWRNISDFYVNLRVEAIFYKYQQFSQHRICFSIQPPDYSDPWPRLARSSSFFLIMLFNNTVRQNLCSVHCGFEKVSHNKLRIKWEALIIISLLYIYAYAAIEKRAYIEMYTSSISFYSSVALYECQTPTFWQ
jgi:hypothetical protein